MRDVAEKCGVSETTVSHAINGTKQVSAKTRAKIEQAMLELQFFRDSHARRLARGHSDFLGLIISDIENPFFPSVIKAFENGAVANGYEILLCTTNYDPERIEQSFRKMIENKCPGVAVMTSQTNSRMATMLAENGIAAVFLDSNGHDKLKSNIRLNYARGATETVHYLHNLGHRHFALVAGPQNRPSHLAYKKAVLTALADFELKPHLIVANNDIVSGELAVQKLMTEKKLPTAVLCSSDLTAISVVRTLTACGLRVPADVSVVGVDDIPFAELNQPPLTTVRVPRQNLGSLALETLRTMLEQNSEKGIEAVLDTELVIRGSTALAKQD